VDLSTLLSRLQCLRSVCTFSFPGSHTSALLALRRITAARIVNNIRAVEGIGFLAEGEECTGTVQLPGIQELDASITMIRVALSDPKSVLWKGPLHRVPPMDLDAARQLLGVLREEMVTARLDWIVGTIELSQLALELGLVVEAAAFAAEVVSAKPEPAELHDVHTICGCCEAFEMRTAVAASHLLKSVDALLETDFYVGARNPAPNVTLAAHLLGLGCVGPVRQFLERCKRCWPRLSVALVGWMSAIAVSPRTAPPHELEVFNDRNILSRMACLALIPRTHGLTNEGLKALRLQIRDAVKGRLPPSSN
jgi:hypothetical protein